MTFLPELTFRAAMGLTDEQREVVERMVRESMADMRDSDSAYWLGLAKTVRRYAERVADAVADGDEPLSWLAYAEADADRACA